MKIPAPNYTQCPNVFFDNIMRSLNEGEMRVMLVLMRQTFGWHKEWDRISLSQMAEKTGYDRRSVCRILKKLIEKGLVSKRKSGDNGEQKCWYSLVTEEPSAEFINEDEGFESQEEMDIFKECYTSDRRVTPPSDRRVTGPVTGGSLTKETLTKENIQKKQQHAASPLPAAASFTQKKSSAAKVRTEKIYHCLLDVDIPSLDKVEITQKYSEDVVKQAIAWATHSETKINKSLAQALKWACQNKPQIPVSKEDESKKNREYAIKYDNMKTSRHAIVACNKHVEIVSPGSQHSFTLSYDAKGFIDQFQSQLRKCGFKIL